MTAKPFIPVNLPRLSGNESKYLNECIESGWISSEGPFVSRFESSISQRVGRRHGIAVTNGTAALDVAIEALSIGVGDEVILPSLTIISCITQILRSGASPVFVDSDPFTWNMDVSGIEEKITSKTKAILAPHIYGLPVDLAPLIQLTKKYNLYLIEDAAEAIGQTYNGRECGSFGDISVFSFYPNKHITTGEGGMILTDSDEIADKCRSLRNLCFQPKQRFVHDRLGWNLRMTNLQAAVGLAQLEQLDANILRKRHIGRVYNELLSEVPAIQLPIHCTEYSTNIYWVYGVVLKHSIPATQVMSALAAAGIGSRPFFYPLHLQPLLKQYPKIPRYNLPTSEHLSTYGFYLPSGLGHSDSDLEDSATALIDVLTDLT